MQRGRTGHRKLLVTKLMIKLKMDQPHKKKDAKDGSTTHKKKGAKDGSTTNDTTGAKDGSVTDEKTDAKDGSTTNGKKYPWEAYYPPFRFGKKFCWKRFKKWFNKSFEMVAKATATNWVNHEFHRIAPSLTPILRKDSVRRFLRLYLNKVGMSYGLMITPQTLSCMVTLNSLRCAKFVLEGKAPELKGRLAYPNCMNPYGYFPLHEAAERFSVDTIKLLLFCGASANVCTSCTIGVIERLLPLHVAVENTCLHKYLEDNLLPNQDQLDYVYKLIHLLRLPEMKIFLDTTRLLATKTDNLVDEIWNYIKDGKLVQAAVLLLAAQEQIRGGHSSKINGNDRGNGFDIIMAHLMRHYISIRLEIGKNGNAWNQEEKRTLIDCAGLLADIIPQAGEALDAYIQSH